MTPRDRAAAQRSGASPAPLPPAGLDAQIALLEQRLVAREALVQSSARLLGQRAQQVLRSRSWLPPALGGAALLWLGWRWWHRRSPAPRAGAALRVGPAARPPDGLVVRLLASLAAPDRPPPVGWRERLSRSDATAAVSTGVSILRWLLSRRDR